MATEYRVMFVSTFSNVTDRDKVSTWLKTQFINAKTAGTITYKKASITTDDYPIEEVTKNIVTL